MSPTGRGTPASARSVVGPCRRAQCGRSHVACFATLGMGGALRLRKARPDPSASPRALASSPRLACPARKRTAAGVPHSLRQTIIGWRTAPHSDPRHAQPSAQCTPSARPCRSTARVLSASRGERTPPLSLVRSAMSAFTVRADSAYSAASQPWPCLAHTLVRPPSVRRRCMPPTGQCRQYPRELA